MNELAVFNNEEFGQVRTMMIDGEPWFVGKDVAIALGYKDTDQALRKHIDSEDKLTRQFNGSGQNREMTIINESGLYSLVMSSKLPSAKDFKRWVTSEILPAIRKTGKYCYTQPELSAEQTIKCAEIISRCNKYNIGYVLHILKDIYPNIESVMFNEIVVDKQSISLKGCDIPFDFRTFSNMLDEQSFSLAQFASMIGSSPSSVSNWKNGKVKPCTNYRNLICEVLGEQPGYFDKNPRRTRRTQCIK